MSTTGGLHSLATIIKRLEAATSRLEDLAVVQAGAKPADAPGAATPGTPTSPAVAAAPAATAAAAAAAAAAALAAPVPVPAAPPAAVSDAKSVAAFDAIVNGPLARWLALTRELKSDGLNAQANDMEITFASQREFVVAAARCRKPDDKELIGLQTKLSTQIEQVSKRQEQFRKQREWTGFMAAVADGAPIGGWVAPPTQALSYVKEITDTVKYHTNRILMAHKNHQEPDPKHPEWVKAYLALLDSVQGYIKEYHTKELQWNPQGITFKEYLASAAAPPSGGPPPPPPPPPPAPAPPPPPAGAAPAPGGGGINAVFDDLNKGEDVTKRLRKVDKSEMTHKNPALRAQGPIEPKAPAAAAGKRPVLPRKPQSLQTKKPPKLALDGNKWAVEHYEGGEVTVKDAEMGHTVNIFACKNTTILVKGKVNKVTLLNCTKTAVLIDSVISSVEVTASPSFTIQITGTAPTVQVDNTDQGQIFLSKQCIDTVEILTAKCSSINVSLPVAGEEDGIFDEKPLGEMIRTVVKDGQLVSNIVEHTG